MNRRVLIAEPDAAARGLMERVLTASGYFAEGFAAAQHARILLDDEAFDLAVVDELAGDAGVLDEVRFLRARYPRLPLVVTGTMLTQRELLELLRLGVQDVLPKPFTPVDLRDAVGRATARGGPLHAEALDFAAALAAAEWALATGDPTGAAAPLVRAYARAPFDAEAASLEALRAELEGRDADAERIYRAALALRRDEGFDAPDPHEGLARLAAYGAARPVSALRPAFASAPLWIVGDPVHELPQPPPPGAEQGCVVVLALGLTSADGEGLYLRESAVRAFALLAGDARPERVAAAAARVSSGPLLAHAATADRLDLARATLLREGHAPPAGAPGAAARP